MDYRFDNSKAPTPTSNRSTILVTNQAIILQLEFCPSLHYPKYYLHPRPPHIIELIVNEIARPTEKVFLLYLILIYLIYSKDPSNTTTSSSPVSTPTVTISTANTSPNRTSSSPTATSPQPNNNVRRYVFVILNIFF